jgi:hypothetical protein
MWTRGGRRNFGRGQAQIRIFWLANRFTQLGSKRKKQIPRCARNDSFDFLRESEFSCEQTFSFCWQ